MTAPDDSIDYGPLAALIGTWQGDKGMDVSPEPDGEEASAFHETIVFEAIGEVSNAETQTLAGLRYHQVVRRNANNEVFHNETGYLLWDATASVVMQTLSIPRGVSLVAGGKYDGSGPIAVHAAADHADWPIAQSPFMRDNAKTLRFDHTIDAQGDQLSYHETMYLDIYGKRFEHTDRNQLNRV